MLHAWHAGLVVVAWMGLTAPQASKASVTVGVLPFDVAAVQGATYTASQALAQLLRIEMLSSKALQPELIEPPSGTRLPISPKAAAEAGARAGVNVVLVGTVLEASTSHSSRRAGTGRLGTYIGGSLSRTSADVSVHIQLIDPSAGTVAETFEVKGNASETGVGADLSNTLGSFSLGESGWDKTPMGKALREVARKIVAETAKRAGKF